MKEIIAIICVSYAAVGISNVFCDITNTNDKARATAERIERMKANPSPSYDPYPNP